MEQLNIQEIASAKIKAMHKSGEIQKRIEDGIQSTIEKTIDSAVNDYTFKSAIEKKIETELSEVAKNINFSAYTSFLTQKMDQVIGKYVKGELAKKIKDEFSKIYLQKRESIKLSEIFDFYTKWLNEKLDNNEKQSWERYQIDMEDERYWLRFRAGNPQSTRKYSSSGEYSLEFSLSIDSNNKKEATLSWVRLDGDDFKKDTLRRYISDFETLILNLLFNETKIIIDIHPDEVETYLDIDSEYYD